jgi:hypothetical protein
MARHEALELPVEITGLIVDEIGAAFIDRAGPDYQSQAVRQTLYNLSLSALHLRDDCRRYLWHTVTVECNEAAPTIPREYRLQMKSLLQTLLAHNSPSSLVKRLELTFGRGGDTRTYVDTCSQIWPTLTFNK